MHLDIYARDLADLEAFGATVVEPRHGTRTWTVMADPEGGEFCAFLRSEIPAERLHGLVVDSDGDSYVAERSVGDGTVKVLTDTIQKERRGDGAVIWLTATYEVCGPDGEVGGVIIRNASGLYDVPEKAQRVGPTQAVAVALGREGRRPTGPGRAAG